MILLKTIYFILFQLVTYGGHAGGARVKPEVPEVPRTTYTLRGTRGDHQTTIKMSTVFVAFILYAFGTHISVESTAV